jgi:hypothetical protein
MEILICFLKYVTGQLGVGNEIQNNGQEYVIRRRRENEMRAK